MGRRIARTAWISALALFGLSGAELAAPKAGAADPLDVSYYSFFEGWAPDAHPLDPVPRFLEPRERVPCRADDVVVYRSRPLRYRVRVHPAFAERLARFETLVTELAVAHYGRAPRRLVHRGAFSCREARGRRGRISEHAFGNALDLQGFDFGRLPRGAVAPDGMHRSLRRGFRVRVLTHWSPRRARDARHAAFLHALAEAVRSRTDVFRGIVGPPRPRHRDHLHLDAAPWRYAMFGYDRAEAE